MTSKERAVLRSAASTEPCILQIGKSGVNAGAVSSAAEALAARELIKFSVLENSGLTPREAAEALAEACGAVVVTCIGSKAVLYKKKPKDSKFGI